MKKHSEQYRTALRLHIMGLGEGSYRKSYYPELQEKISELERFKSLLDQANDMIFLLKITGGRIIYSSLSCSRLLFYSTKELLEMTILDLLPKPLPDAFRRLIEQPYQPEAEESVITTSLIRADGEELPVETAIRLVSSTDSPVAVLVARDIAKRKQVEEALKKSRDDLEKRVDERTAELKVYMAELERSNEALEEFCYVASHDLQEPLRKVLTFAELTKKYAEVLPIEGIDYLNRMSGAAKRMQAFIQSLLAYSRITTRTEPFVAVDLNEVVKRVLEDLSVRIEAEGGTVYVENLPTIEADPSQMHQLFQNLIGNALKYHKERKPVVRVYSKLFKEAGSARIYIEDNGIGFDLKHLERIFAPFQRLHGRGEYEGTGIGLAICKKIAERHGGSITAETKPGEGSTFIVTLPVSRGKTQESLS